jgi:proteasome lid subunit RPN8/RPN11
VRALLDFEAGGLDLVAAFHSHPNGPTGVSESDRREWRYPEALLVVLSPRSRGWTARAFSIDDAGETEVPLVIEGVPAAGDGVPR